MNKKTMEKLTAVCMLILVTLSGCTFTAAQLSDWVASDKGLAGLTIGSFWDLNVVPTLNPDGDKTTQSFLDLGRRVSISLAGNAINQDIPLDPGSIK